VGGGVVGWRSSLPTDLRAIIWERGSRTAGAGGGGLIKDGGGGVLVRKHCAGSSKKSSGGERSGKIYKKRAQVSSRRGGDVLFRRSFRGVMRSSWGLSVGPIHRGKTQGKGLGLAMGEASLDVFCALETVGVAIHGID